jgi:hypothetical protein
MTTGMLEIAQICNVQGMSLKMYDYWKIIYIPVYRKIIGGSQNIDKRYQKSVQLEFFSEQYSTALWGYPFPFFG